MVGEHLTPRPPSLTGKGEQEGNTAMQAGTKRHQEAAGVLWALLALVLWLSGMPPARAQIRPASDPIVGSRLQQIVEMIPDAPLDLPPYLAKPSDAYLLVTAGASYTDVQLLANPEVPPQTVARALSSALSGTPLRGQPVEWSADRYSAAQVSAHHSRFGAMRGANTVPVAPLLSGLRQAGLTPHLLLRVPRYARTSAPPPPYGTKTFCWYDVRHLAGQSGVSVTAALSPLSLALPLAFFLVVPVIGLLGLSLAGFLSRRGQRDAATRRQVFRSVNACAMMSAMLALFAGVFAFFRSPAVPALADLWFGSSATGVLVPFLPIAALPSMLFLITSHKQETRRFGPVPTAPAIPMSDEEKAVRQRVARWSALPHLIGMGVLFAAMIAVPRRSPLYPIIHPLTMFLPVVGGGLAARIFQKRLDRFTQKTPDDGLTWRARQLGQTLGVRMPDVFVEDSSRATHLAFASHQGHHITLSRKLQETFTPAETDFVLAHHLACMKRRGAGDRRWMRSLLPLPMLVPAVLVLSPRFIPGAPTMTALILSPWFFPALIGYFGLFLVLTIALGSKGAHWEVQQDILADQDALEATGDPVAADSALDKLGADAISSERMVAMPAAGTMSEKLMAQTATGRIALRRAALQKTAQALGLAPTTGAEAGRNATG